MKDENSVVWTHIIITKLTKNTFQKLSNINIHCIKNELPLFFLNFICSGHCNNPRVKRAHSPIHTLFHRQHVSSRLQIDPHAAHIPGGSGNSQSYGRNEFSEHELSMRNTFRPGMIGCCPIRLGLHSTGVDPKTTRDISPTAKGPVWGMPPSSPLFSLEQSYLNKLHQQERGTVMSKTQVKTQDYRSGVPESEYR